MSLFAEIIVVLDKNAHDIHQTKINVNTDIVENSQPLLFIKKNLNWEDQVLNLLAAISKHKQLCSLHFFSIHSAVYTVVNLCEYSLCSKLHVAEYFQYVV